MAAVKKIDKKTGAVSYVGGASLNAKQQGMVDSGRATLGYGYVQPTTKVTPPTSNTQPPAPVVPPAPLGTPSQYQYALKDGTMKTVSAKTAEEAQKLASADVNANPRTGVGLLQQTTTSTRNQFDANSAKLDERLTRGVATTQNTGGTVNIVRDIDNGDGTRTVTYSDGKTARVSATKNADGSESYKEISAGDNGTDENDPFGIADQQSKLTRDIEREKSYVSKTLDGLMGQMDVAYDGLISGLKANYEARAAAMIESNKRLLRGKTTLGMREGRARYTPITEGGLLSDEENAGHARVSALQAEMLKAVAEASVARADKRLSSFNSKMDRLAELDKKLRDEVASLWDQAQKRDQELRDREKAERAARQEDLKYQTDRAESVSETVGNTLDQFKTPAEKQAFLEQYSAKTGIDMAILLDSVNAARRKVNKEELDMRNVSNSIYNRNRAQDRADRQETFNPTAKDRSLVGKYLAKNGTDSDTKKADEDKDFFYFILDKAEAEGLE